MLGVSCLVGQWMVVPWQLVTARGASVTRYPSLWDYKYYLSRDLYSKYDNATSFGYTIFLISLFAQHNLFLLEFLLFQRIPMKNKDLKGHSKLFFLVDVLFMYSVYLWNMCLLTFHAFSELFISSIYKPRKGCYNK